MHKVRKFLSLVSIATPVFFTFNSPALTIVPTFDTSITSDPNSAKIQAAINAAIQVYQTNFSDSVTVNILFKQMSSGLGQSSTYYNDVSYSSFISALQSRATTTNDTTALAHLPTGTINPVNGHTLIRSTLAHLRAMGFPNMNLPAGYYDSTISINFSLCNLDRVTINPSKYDLMAVAMHEMDEVLGTSSALSSETEARVADLFRYSSTGARNFTTSGDDAYFSLDGVNRLVQYNQSSSGDYGDWWSLGTHTPRVQDAFGTAGVVLNLGVELVVLDVIGWNRVASQSGSSSSVTAPVFQSVTRVGNQINFTWSATAGQNYQVQYTTNLLKPSWTNLGAPISATGSVASSSDTIGSDPQRFYRLQIPSSTSGIGTANGFVDTRTLKTETRVFHEENKKK
jgi:hypothetical protein